MIEEINVYNTINVKVSDDKIRLSCYSRQRILKFEVSWGYRNYLKTPDSQSQARLVRELTSSGFEWHGDQFIFRTPCVNSTKASNTTPTERHSSRRIFPPRKRTRKEKRKKIYVQTRARKYQPRFPEIFSIRWPLLSYRKNLKRKHDQWPEHERKNSAESPHGILKEDKRRRR